MITASFWFLINSSLFAGLAPTPNNPGLPIAFIQFLMITLKFFFCSFESDGANNLKNFDMIRSFLTNATLVSFIDLPFSIIFILVIYYIGGPIVLIPIVVVTLILFIGLILKRNMSMKYV